ncbi:agmatine deiminase family protein [Sulfurospirillum arcachonense]|uniref:agmatine deiminase family protein n=1 Tax=Sulfurospirillum arcachonense TaxID=57666 RepID=UPI000468A5FE|nr:agmatine deiminase family protein [Sulfurospirillum arcachonense]
MRLPAEWEQQKSIMLVFPTNQKDWQHSIKEVQETYVAFINAIREFQKCVVICSDKKILDAFFDSFENIEVFEYQTNDTWMRDFGAIDFLQNNQIKSYNFKFNAWGDKFDASLDDKFNSVFFKENIVDIDFILEGGSIDSNGEGVLLTTSTCIHNENRNHTYTKKQILKKLKKLFGLKEVILLEHGGLIGDDTDSHVDTLARFINKDTIVYAKCYDVNDIHFEELNKMEQELQKTNFHLVPLPLPNAKYFEKQRLPATYLNFVFLNGALIVPTYNDVNDEITIKILKNHIKNRKVITIDATILIREHGSLHCSCINKMLPL